MGTQGPEVTIDEPHLNFGLVRLGDTVAKELTLTNMVQLTTKWTLKDMHHLQSESMIEASVSWLYHERTDCY